MHEEHQHGPECGCVQAIVDEAHHICDPYCYHNSDSYKLRQARKQRRATHEKVWNAQLGRVRSPYPRQPVVPLHLLGVVPLIVPEDAPVPSPEQIQEAQKEHKRRRNARRRARK